MWQAPKPGHRALHGHPVVLVKFAVPLFFTAFPSLISHLYVFQEMDAFAGKGVGYGNSK